MENEILITKQQFDNLIKLSGIEKSNSKENEQELVSKALIALERKLNYFVSTKSFSNSDDTNVLIVDDTELSIFQLSVLLEKIGLNVYVARNKEEALAEYKKKNFDFLILDLYMPDYIDGFDLIKEANRLRNEENRDFKICVISGTDNPNIIQEAYKMQIDDFIPKAPQWHEDVLKFITNCKNKITNDEFKKYFVNENICSLTLYKINNEKYVDKIIKEVNSNVLTGKPNIIFNLEHIKIFSDNFANIFSEVYKATSQKNGIFVLVKPPEDVIKALNYVFLSDSIKIFDSVEDAVEYIEINSAV